MTEYIAITIAGRYALSEGILPRCARRAVEVGGLAASACKPLLAIGVILGLNATVQPNGRTPATAPVVSVVPFVELRDHSSEVRSLAFSPDGGRLASVSQDEVVMVWDWKASRRLLRLTEYPAFRALFSRDGQRLIISCRDGSIHILDAKTGKQEKALVGHEGIALRIDCTGEKIISGGEDKTVRIWDMKAGKQLDVVRGFTSSIVAVRAVADGASLWSVDRHGLLVHWDLKESRLLGQLRVLDSTGQDCLIASAAVSGDGGLALLGKLDGSTEVWDLRQAAPKRTLRTGPGVVFALAFSPDGKLAIVGKVFPPGVSASKENEVHCIVDVWDSGAGKLLGQTGPHSLGVWAVACSPDGKVVAVGRGDGTIVISKLPTMFDKGNERQDTATATHPSGP